jgi:hypothetical protein
MRTVMVQYKVKPESAAENERLIKEVFAQLARDKVPGVSYQVFKLADGMGFVHVSSSQAQENPLTQLEAFKNFTADIKDRRLVHPETVEMQVVGAYDGM